MRRRRFLLLWPFVVTALYCVGAYLVPLATWGNPVFVQALAGAGNTEAIALPDANGAWCWFAEPRALALGDTLVWGYVTRDGSIAAAQRDAQGNVTETILHARLERDDHNNPTFLRRASDGRLLTFYSQHVAGTIYQRLSSQPDDATQWEPERSLHDALGGTTYTYPSPVQLVDAPGQPIHLYFREYDVNEVARWAVATSLDEGETWSERTPVIGATYTRIATNGRDRIDFLVSDHPFHSPTAVYHLYYQDGAYYRTNGERIDAPPPIQTREMTLVYDGGDVRAWVWDLTYDTDGNPVGVFATFPSLDNHIYHYAHWDGATWQTHVITEAGPGLYAQEAYYSGGITIDRNDPRTVYLSRQVNSRYEMYQYRTEDDGATWLSAPLTQGSLVDNLRPYAVGGAAPVVLWQRGRYSTYTDYNMLFYAWLRP